MHAFLIPTGLLRLYLLHSFTLTMRELYTWSGDKVLHLSGQGSLYVCPTYESYVARIRVGKKITNTRYYVW